MTRRKTLEQERANRAWKCVREVKDGNYAAKYGSLARKAPSLVQTNGLGQTLAFLLSKAKDQDNEHRAFYGHVSKWVTEQMKWEKSLMEEVVSRDSADYRQATAEAMAFMMWLRRFAEAELGEAEE
jgi:CRISPR-associated protein Cmr5